MLTIFFCFGSIIFTILFCYNNKYIKKIIKDNWRYLLLLILINFLFKCPFDLNFFHGLEYEDAYIYKASARYIYENISQNNSTINSYLTDSCRFGSLKACHMSSTYSGHLMGYPHLILFFYSIFGYHPDIANFVSLFLSSLSILWVFMLANMIISDKKYILTCCFIYITLPIFNVFASTSLSELTSNFYIGLLLLSYLCYVYYSSDENNSNFFMKTINNSFIFFNLGVLLLIKRENISMVLCLPLCSIAHLYFNQKNINVKKIKERLITLSPIFIIFIFFYIFILDIFSTVEVENIEIGQEAFSIAYLKLLMPIFFQSFFNIEWYFFFSIFLILGLFQIFKEKNVFIFPVIIFLFYFILYALHHRSYYFIKAGEVSMFGTIRYMMGLVSLYAIISGMGLYKSAVYIHQIVSKYQKSYFLKSINRLTSITVATLCFLVSFYVRSSFIEEEYRSRIQPVEKTCELISKDKSIIITSVPLLFHIYGGAELGIIDFCSIDKYILKSIKEIMKSDVNLVLLLSKQDLDTLNQQRFIHQFRLIKDIKKVVLYSGEHYLVYKILNT